MAWVDLEGRDSAINLVPWRLALREHMTCRPDHRIIVQGAHRDDGTFGRIESLDEQLGPTFRAEEFFPRW